MTPFVCRKQLKFWSIISRNLHFCNATNEEERPPKLFLRNPTVVLKIFEPSFSSCKKPILGYGSVKIEFLIVGV